ncbi:MAG: L-rhamnose isomerase [Candidatus Aminicenantales bacterium]
MDASAPDKNYESSRDRYAELGIDTDSALEILGRISLSLQCLPGEAPGGEMAPAGRPGRARSVHDLRQDLHRVFSLVPGRHRIHLQSIYGEFEREPVERNAYEPSHYRGWIEWAKQEGLKLDFSATCFAHPQAASGYTLSSRNKEVRRYWIEHVKRCRKISATMGREMKTACIHNLGLPDGSGEIPFDRWSHRAHLRESLDEIFETEFSPSQMKDALEGGRSGVGTSGYAVASYDFFLGYAMTRGKIVCLDLGHLHPVELAADRASAVLQFSDEVLLHVPGGFHGSGGGVMRNDVTRAIAEEIVRGEDVRRVHILLDYVDAGPNRIGSWVLGARSVLRALLLSLLEPARKKSEIKDGEDGFHRLAMMEQMKDLPFGAVWDHYCLKGGVPPSGRWEEQVSAYEKKVSAKRP